MHLVSPLEVTLRALHQIPALLEVHHSVAVAVWVRAVADVGRCLAILPDDHGVQLLNADMRLQIIHHLGYRKHSVTVVRAINLRLSELEGVLRYALNSSVEPAQVADVAEAQLVKLLVFVGLEADQAVILVLLKEIHLAGSLFKGLKSNFWCKRYYYLYKLIFSPLPPPNRTNLKRNKIPDYANFTRSQSIERIRPIVRAKMGFVFACSYLPAELTHNAVPASQCISKYA